MLSVDQAQHALLEAVPTPAATETRPLEESLGYVLAQDCISQVDVPPADNSAMDGYALRVNPAAASPLPAGLQLPISQTIAAGSAPLPLASNTCARILTGAELPPNANAVIIQENITLSTTPNENLITLNSAVNIGDNVRPQGQDVAKGATVAYKGTKLTAACIGVLAAIGIDRVTLYRPIKVALVNTGEELVNPGQPLAPGQIYNSNRYALQALLEGQNAVVNELLTLPDDLEKTQAALLKCAQNNDVIISTGGVSVGDEDHIKNAITSLGELNLWKIKLKPGKPLAFGHIPHGQGSTPILGLPGNPVSAFVTFCLFAKPLLAKLSGQPHEFPAPWQAPANFSIDRPRQRPEYARAKRGTKGIELFNNQSSGVLSSLHWAEGLVLIPANTTIEPGQTVDYFPFSELI